MEALTLSESGIIVTIAMGVLFAILGGSLWWLFVIGMLLFLVLSALVTKLGMGYKRKKMLGQDPRGVSNVLANGTMPLVMAILYRGSIVFGAHADAKLCLFGFIASVAAITADKFASEIGVLGPNPISLIGLKRVRKGVSGGVTWLGLAASAIAAGIIGIILLPLAATQIGTFSVALLFCVVMISGFAGSVIDSVFGYFEERHIGNKFTSNFLCSLAGAIIGIAFLLL